MIRASVLTILPDVLTSLTGVRPRRADPPGAFRVRWGRLGAAAMDPGALASIANAIQDQEGYYPGSLAYQNNNPGNLVYAGQPGATPGAGGFARFATYNDGYNALVNQINLDATRGTDVNGNPTVTLAQFLTSYAPPSENDTGTYIQNVSMQTGYSPDASLLDLGSSTGPPIDAVDAADGAVDYSWLPIAAAVVAAAVILPRVL